MAAIALVIFVTIVLAILLAALLSSAGIVGAVVVVVLGMGTVVWLAVLRATGRQGEGSPRRRLDPGGGPGDTRGK